MDIPMKCNVRLFFLVIGSALFIGGNLSCAKQTGKPQVGPTKRPDNGETVRTPHKGKKKIIRYTDVDIETTPPNADLYLNGAYKGKTPFTLKLARDRRKHSIIFEKPGYMPLERNVIISSGPTLRKRYRLNKDISIDCEHTNAFSPETDLDTDGPAAIWILNRKAKLLNCPGSGRPIQYKRKFLARFYIANEIERNVNGDLWKLLLHEIGESSDSTFVKAGWIGKKELLDDKFPLINPNTHSLYKAIIFRPVGSGSRSVPIFPNADLTGPPLAQAEVDSIFYIYRLHPTATEAVMENSIPSSVSSILIGRSPGLDSFTNDAKSKISGWVDSANVLLWNTSLAIDLRSHNRVDFDRQSAQNKRSALHISLSTGKTSNFDSMLAPVLIEEQGDYRIYLNDSILTKYGSSNIKSKIGWVKNDNPKKRVYLVNYVDFVQLQSFFDELIDSADSPLGIHRNWAAIIRYYTGTPCNPAFTIKDCLRESTLYSLFPLRNKFLEYSLNKLVELKQVNLERSKSIYCDLTRTERIMRGILENQKLNLAVPENGNCEPQIKSKLERNYWFDSGGFQMAWIPKDDLP